MIDESDKSLFRNAVEQQKTFDKDSNNKNHPVKNKLNKPFENYKYLYEPNITGSEPVIHFKVGLSPKIIKKMKKISIHSGKKINSSLNKLQILKKN